MFLVSAENPDKVVGVVEDIDNVKNFDHLDLGKLNTLELTEVAPESMDWVQGEPIVFDEGSGVVLLQYSKKSLTWLQSNIEALEEYGVSKDAIESFCSKNIQQLFCLDTF